MISRIYPTCLALLALLGSVPSAPAQTAAVSARDYLRADLREESLIKEAFRAAKRVPPGAKFELAAMQGVARVLIANGREADARALTDQAALAVRKELEYPYALTSVSGIYGRVHTHEEMHAFLGSLPDRSHRAHAAIGFVKECVRREDMERLRDAVGHLTAASYLGWTPKADAWLAIGWTVLGQEDSARAYKESVLEGPYSRGDELESGDAIGSLIDHALKNNQIDEACRMIDTYAASPKVKDRYIYAIGNRQTRLIRELAQRGEFERARARIEPIAGGRDRAVAFAELGVALWKQEGAVSAEKDLLAAGELAKRTGILSYCRVAEVLHSGGFEEAATAMAWDALSKLIELEKGSGREMNAGFLAQTFLKLGHDDAMQLFESELTEETGIDFLISLAGLYASQENLEGLKEILGVFQQADAESGTTNYYIQAASTAARKLKDRESGDRFAAEFAREVLKHARSQSADRRAWLLAVMLENGLAVPVELSSYHPWSVPPTLAGHWTTPEDAEAAAALLTDALGDFPVPQVRGIRKRALRFHPDAELYEFDGFRGGLRYHTLLLRMGEDVKLLDGSKEVLDPVSLAANWRTSDEALFDLVHLIIGSRSSQYGRYRIIENLGVLDELRIPGAQLPKLKLKGTRLIERTEDGATLEADILANKKLDRITISVNGSGQVSIELKEVIAEDLPVELEFYIGGCFERRHVSLNGLWELNKTDKVAWAYGMAELYALGFGEGGWRADPILAFHFLGIAKEGDHPNAIQLIGQAWRDGKGVAADPLEAIEWLVVAATRGNLDACIDAADLLLASPSPERRDRARTVLIFGKERGHERCAEKLSELDAASKAK